MEKKRKISWIPQTKTKSLMMNRGEDEGLYGGAAGGGKSDFLLVEAPAPDPDSPLQGNYFQEDISAAHRVN